jgi:hypothetical protein
MNHSGQGNGHTDSPIGNEDSVPHIDEDATGVTMDSGKAVCRFDAQRGGRLSRWQWRTILPPDALNPATRHNPARLLELVDSRDGALIDHFLPLGTKPQDFVEGTEREYGDFRDGEFRSQVVDVGGEIRVGLMRDGKIEAGNRVAEVRIAKSAALRPGAADLVAHYMIINSSERPLQILFGVEFNLYAPRLAEDPGAAGECFYLIDGVRPDDSSLGSTGVSPGCTSVTLGNARAEAALQLGWDRECDLWRMPAPGDGAAVRLVALWRLQLPARDNWAMGLWLAPT